MTSTCGPNDYLMGWFIFGIIILIIYVSIDPLPKVVPILYIIEIADIHLEHINYPKVF